MECEMCGQTESWDDSVSYRDYGGYRVSKSEAMAEARQFEDQTQILCDDCCMEKYGRY